MDTDTQQRLLTNPFRRGERIVIPKGTPYRTTHPGKDGLHKTGRAATVTLRSVYRSYVDTYSRGRGEPILVPGTVTTAGTGGYWKDYVVTEDLLVANGHPVTYENLDDAR